MGAAGFRVPPNTTRTKEVSVRQTIQVNWSTTLMLWTVTISIAVLTWSEFREAHALEQVARICQVPSESW